MKRLFRTAYILIGVVAAAAALPAHAQTGYFAVGASPSSIYLVRGGATWIDDTYVKPVYGGGSSISGLAVWGNRVFAADKAANRLIIGRLGNILSAPVLTDIRIINLEEHGLTKPASIALDESGGLYVISSEKVGGLSKYAYVTADGGNWNGAINVVTTSIAALLDDVTGLGHSEALIACDKTAGDGVPRVTHSVRATGATASEPSPVPTNYLPSQPSAAAVLSGVRQSPLGFIVSRVDEGSPLDDVTGTLEVFETQSGTAVFSSRLPQGLNPEDISVFSLNGTNYLSIIGRARKENNVCQAWRIELSENGAPLMETLSSFTFTGDTMGGQKCAVSGDGKVFWSTHNGLTPVGATVFAMATQSWTGPMWDLSATQNLGISNIAVLDYVPEPSGLAALGGMLGALALGRRRRTR